MITVYVCPDRDIECGDFERNWCASCPKRAASPVQGAASSAASSGEAKGAAVKTWQERCGITRKPEGQVERAMAAEIADWRSAATAAKPSAAEQAPTEPRFFMDHGLWHDRVTGQHMYTQDQYDELRRDSYVGGVEDQMNGIAAAWAVLRAAKSHVLPPPRGTGSQHDAEADDFGFALMKHLGPAALTGGKMSVYRAFELGWMAKESAASGSREGRDAFQESGESSNFLAANTNKGEQP